MSIIQSLALAYLLQTVAKEFSSEGGLTALTAFQALSALFTIVMVWHEYAMGTLLYKWILDIWDSFIPFLLGTSQYWIIASIDIPKSGHKLSEDRFGLWLAALSGFAVCGYIAYVNQGKKAEADNRRNKYLAKPRRSGKQSISYIAVFVVATAIAALFPIPKWTQTVAALAVALLFFIEMLRLNGAYRHQDIANDSRTQ